MKTKVIFVILTVIIITVCFSSCSINSQYDTEIFAMDTVMTMSAYGSKSETAVKKAEVEINRLDTLFSLLNKNSDVYKLNNSKSFSVSNDTLNLIKRSIEFNSLTNGAFDITTEPFTKAWGFYSDIKNRVPNKSELKKLKEFVGADNITVDNNLISLSSNTSIDLGGIAKGYASLKVADILKENSINSAIISLGGNVRAIGTKPDGSEWCIGITDPDDNSKQIGTVKVNDKAVVTCGGYQRNFKFKGKTYHHIIDPNIGYPASSGLKSVTIVSEDDVLADALSTAFFVMGFDNAYRLYKEHSSEYGVIFITDNNEIKITDNLQNQFTSQKDFKVV